MERKIVYFEDIGPQNTEITFNSVKERLNGSDIKKIVIASTTGATARLASDYFKDTALVIQASSSRNMKNLRVNEIICKPL